MNSFSHPGLTASGSDPARRRVQTAYFWTFFRFLLLGMCCVLFFISLSEPFGMLIAAAVICWVLPQFFRQHLVRRILLIIGICCLAASMWANQWEQEQLQANEITNDKAYLQGLKQGLAESERDLAEAKANLEKIEASPASDDPQGVNLKAAKTNVQASQSNVRLENAYLNEVESRLKSEEQR